MFNEHNDLINFAKFLYKIQIKKRKKNIKLIYTYKIRVAFILVGKPKVVKYYGTRPYLSYLRSIVRNDLDYICILSKGKLNTLIAKYLAKQALHEKLVTEFSVFTGKIIDDDETIKDIGVFVLRPYKVSYPCLT